MAVLVTGGAGYIGSHMVWRLIDGGEKVVVLDNLITGFEWAISPEAKFVRGDIGDQEFVENLIKSNEIDAIIHFAGSIVVPESVSNPLKYYANNTANSRNLIEAAVNCGVQSMIFSSTAAVYGHPEVVPVSENATLNPLSPYGTSKLMTELMLRDTAAAHEFNYAAIRYFNVAGADPAGRTGQSTANATHLIKVACQTALGQRGQMHVFGTDFGTRDGTGIRDYIHVTDLVDAHALALDQLRASPQSFIVNCGYGRGYSVLEVIDAVKQVSGVDFKVEKGPRRDGDSPEVVAKADRIKSLLGWAPKYDDLTQIVDHALNWERSLPKRNQS